MIDKTPPPDETDVADGSPGAPTSIPGRTDTLDVLSKRRRRYVVRYLRDVEDGVASLEATADRLAAWERAVEDDVPEDHRTRLLARLHHADLPRLEEAGLLEYEPRSRTIRYHGDDALEDVLELLLADGG